MEWRAGPFVESPPTFPTTRPAIPSSVRSWRSLVRIDQQWDHFVLHLLPQVEFYDFIWSAPSEGDFCQICFNRLRTICHPGTGTLLELALWGRQSPSVGHKSRGTVGGSRTRGRSHDVRPLCAFLTGMLSLPLGRDAPREGCSRATVVACGGVIVWDMTCGPWLAAVCRGHHADILPGYGTPRTRGLGVFTTPLPRRGEISEELPEVGRKSRSP